MSVEAEIVKFGDVCSLDRVHNKGAALPYVGLEDIASGESRFIGNLEPKKVQSSTFRFTSEHILYGRLRPYLNKVYLPDFDGHCSTEIFPIRPTPDADRRYLYYWLSMESTVKEIDRTSTGARMPRANVNAILEFPIPAPPLAEQRRIVAILDEVFDGLATATDIAEQNLHNARDLFNSYLSFIFEKSWATRALGDICENLDSRRTPVTKRDRKPGNIPYYGASGAVDYVDGFIFDEDLLLVSEDGANLVMRTYPIAFSIAGKSWVNNHAHVLRFPDLASQKFVEHYLNSVSLAPYVNGMAQPKLNQKALNSIPVPWPELDCREKAVARLEGLTAQMERLRETYEARITALAELKQSILQKAFAGELTAPPSQAINEAAE